MIDFLLAGLCATVFALGWFCGRLYSIEHGREVAAAQQRRGDYWFKEYRNATKRRVKR